MITLEYNETLGKWRFPSKATAIQPDMVQLDMTTAFLRPAMILNLTLSSKGMDLTGLIREYCQKTRGREFKWIECARQFLHPNELFSSQEYYNHLLNRDGASLVDLKIRTVPGFSLAICWLIVIMGVWTGAKWTGRVMMATVAVPFVFICTHLIHAATLEGFMSGIQHYMKMEPARLLDPMLWFFASRTVTFSLGFDHMFLAVVWNHTRYFCFRIGYGVLPTLASFNHRRNDILRDSIAVAVGTSLLRYHTISTALLFNSRYLQGVFLIVNTLNRCHSPDIQPNCTKFTVFTKMCWENVPTKFYQNWFTFTEVMVGWIYVKFLSQFSFRGF